MKSLRNALSRGDLGEDGGGDLMNVHIRLFGIVKMNPPCPTNIS
jgi:hypothetical protein